MNEIIELDSVKAFNDLHGLPTLHPLFTVVDLKQAAKIPAQIRMHYGLYAIFVKHGVGCTIHYGRQKNDYQEGTVTSFAPGQVIEVENDNGTIHDVTGFLFHPDLIYGTPLAEKMHQYSFFAYDQKEALHLSDQEQSMLANCLANMEMEMRNPVDRHSRTLLCVHIELFLDYCLRFYDRQFYTRAKVNNDVVQQFEREVNLYLRDGASVSSTQGLPTVKYFADKACLSPSYFGDLIKKETGKTAQEYIRLKLIDKSKQYLRGTSQTVSQIADTLGFQYPQHFIRMFKKQTGMTPAEYRVAES